MAPRPRPQYTPENINHQLQQIYLLDPSSSTENLEQLGPIIKQIHANRQQETYLRHLQALIESKDSDIESICTENYQEFISSVSTLFTVKSYTTSIREKIATLDQSVAHVGKGLIEKKRALLQLKKTAANLDEAIDALQASLKLLDVVDRIGDMIREGRFWSALRSLEDIQATPLTSLCQTPLYQHILSSLPSLRTQIQDAVTSSMKQWLLEVRNATGTVGKVAIEAMDARVKKWRARRDKDPMLRLSRVGSAVEMVTFERSDSNVLNSDGVKIDFQPLYQCIHIYMSLDALDGLRHSYQADRKVQSDLILPSALSLSSLPVIVQEICGFFIVESHVLETTSGFRSEREVEDLWDAVVTRLSATIHGALAGEKDPEIFLEVKGCLTGLVTTLESYSFSTQSLHILILAIFESYANLLETRFGQKLKEVILQDDFLPMRALTESERDSIIGDVWLMPSTYEEFTNQPLPIYLPWSQSFHLCCRDVRMFIQKFYQYVEGVFQHHGNIDDLLSRYLNGLFSNHIVATISKRLGSTSALSQIALIVSSLEYFEEVCSELGRSLTNLRTTQRGGNIRLDSSSFSDLFLKAHKQITALITSKLDAFFELAEYDWTPQTREETPSMYLQELINWLTTVVDSLAMKETYRDDAYKSAVGYIAESLMNFMIGPSVSAMNENAVANIVTDIAFLQNEMVHIGRGHLNSAFTELRSMADIILHDKVQEYLSLGPQARHATYGDIKPRRLQALLEKLGKWAVSRSHLLSREEGEKRKREADAIGRLI